MHGYLRRTAGGEGERTPKDKEKGETNLTPQIKMERERGASRLSRNSGGCVLSGIARHQNHVPVIGPRV